MIALKAAHAAAAIHRAESVTRHSAGEAAEASEHGGRRAFEYLAAMNSLRRIDATSVEELLQDAASVGICSREGSRHGSYASGRGSPTQRSSGQFDGGGGLGRTPSPPASGRWQGKPSLGRLPTQPSMRRVPEQPPGDAV